MKKIYQKPVLLGWMVIATLLFSCEHEVGFGGKGTLSGKVTYKDPVSGVKVPAGNCPVRLTFGGAGDSEAYNFETMTNAEGFYYIEGLELPGKKDDAISWNLHAEKAISIGDTEITFVGDNTQEIEFNKSISDYTVDLELLADTIGGNFTFQGNLYYREPISNNILPAKDFQVTLTATGALSGIFDPVTETVDANGTFHFVAMPGGSYIISGEHTYGNYHFRISDTLESIQTQLNYTDTLEYSELFIQGTLRYRDPTNGNILLLTSPTVLTLRDLTFPLVSPRSSTTQTNGSFSFSNLPPGSYELSGNFTIGALSYTFKDSINLTTSLPNYSDTVIYSKIILRGNLRFQNLLTGTNPTIPAGQTVYLKEGSAPNIVVQSQSLQAGGLFAFVNLDAGTYRLSLSYDAGGIVYSLDTAISLPSSDLNYSNTATHTVAGSLLLEVLDNFNTPQAGSTVCYFSNPGFWHLSSMCGGSAGSQPVVAASGKVLFQNLNPQSSYFFFAHKISGTDTLKATQIIVIQNAGITNSTIQMGP